EHAHRQGVDGGVVAVDEGVESVGAALSGGGGQFLVGHGVGRQKGEWQRRGVRAGPPRHFENFYTGRRAEPPVPTPLSRARTVFTGYQARRAGGRTTE